jgi:hypothetical protein
MSALPEMLRASLWARTLTADQLARVEASIVERTVAAGAHVCHKGDPVEHWIGILDGLLKMAIFSTFRGLSSGTVALTIAVGH